jgi:hypothetical protein
MDLSIKSLPKPVATRALSISFFAACVVLFPDGQATEAWATVGTQDILLEEKIKAQEARFKQAFEMEKEDQEWSQRAEASWTEIFGQEIVREELNGIQLRMIECRMTLCQLELTRSDPSQGATTFEEDVGKLLLFAPWPGSVFGKIENPVGQAPVAIIYMAREGHTLPSLPDWLRGGR